MGRRKLIESGPHCAHSLKSGEQHRAASTIEVIDEDTTDDETIQVDRHERKDQGRRDQE